MINMKISLPMLLGGFLQITASSVVADCPSPFEPLISSREGVTGLHGYATGSYTCVKVANPSFCPECKSGLFHTCKANGKWEPVVLEECVEEEDEDVNANWGGSNNSGSSPHGAGNPSMRNSPGSTLNNQPPTSNLQSDAYMLQLGTFARQSSADKWTEDLRKLGLQATVQKVTVNNLTGYKVLVGPFHDLDELNQVRQMLKADHDINSIIAR